MEHEIGCINKKREQTRVFFFLIMDASKRRKFDQNLGAEQTWLWMSANDLPRLVNVDAVMVEEKREVEEELGTPQLARSGHQNHFTVC